MLLVRAYMLRQGSQALGEVLHSVSPAVDGVRSWTTWEVLCVHVDDVVLVVAGSTYLNGAGLLRSGSVFIRV